MTSSLRRAGSADFARIAALEQRCFGSADGEFTPRQLRALLANPNAYWLMETEGRAVACWLTARNRHARWARLYSLAVDPGLRGQGWGGRLLTAGEDWMRKQGLMVCRAEVKADNHAALRLYASQGYHKVGVLPDYYGNGLDGVRLIKQLKKKHAA